MKKLLALLLATAFFGGFYTVKPEPDALIVVRYETGASRSYELWGHGVYGQFFLGNEENLSPAQPLQPDEEILFRYSNAFTWEYDYIMELLNQLPEVEINEGYYHPYTVRILVLYEGEWYEGTVLQKPITQPKRGTHPLYNLWFALSLYSSFDIPAT